MISLEEAKQAGLNAAKRKGNNDESGGNQTYGKGNRPLVCVFSKPFAMNTDS